MNKITIEHLFLLISLFFGILLAIVVPPFQSPDEDTHFLKSYMISRGQLFPSTKEGEQGYCVPVEMDAYINEKKDYIGKYDQKYSYEMMHGDQLLGSNYTDCKIRRFSTDSVSPIAHIIPALGIQITDYLHSFNDKNVGVSTAVMVQFARVASVIVYTIMCYYAIKLIPKFKRSLFVILLLPNALFLRSTISYDTLLISTCALSLAVIMKLYLDKKTKFNWKYFVFFVFAGYTLLSVKTVYSIIFLPIFMVPVDRFKNKKDMITKYISMVLIVLGLYFITKLPYRGLEDQMFSIDQIGYIKNHIFHFITVVFHNIFDQFDTQMYWMNGTIGLLDTYMPVIHVFITNTILIVSIILDAFTEKVKVPIFIRIGYLLLLVLSVFVVYGIMYAGWTAVITGVIGGELITGVQGRYFLPYLFILPVIITNSLIDKIKNKEIKTKIENKVNLFFTYLPILIVLQIIIMVFVILMRFYMM